MKEFKDRHHSGDNSHNNDSRRDSSNRDDSRVFDRERGSSKGDAASFFGRDKRPRISRPNSGPDSADSDYHRQRTSATRSNDRRTFEPRPPRLENGEQGGEKRSSYNPNFTKDNRRVGSDKPRTWNNEGGAAKPWQKEGNSDRPSKPWNKEGNSDRPARPWNKEGGAAKPWQKEGNSDRPSKPWNKEGYSDRPARTWNKEGGAAKPWQKEGNSDRPSKPWNKEGNSDRPARTWSKEGGAAKPWQKEGNSDRPMYKKKGGFGAKKYDKDNYPRFDAQKISGEMRLNRYVSISGICSRREADDYISAGVVTVNGTVVTELGTKVLSTDVVRFNGEIIKGEKKVYILMNKPKGFVTSLEDPHADKTVMDIIKNACFERVYPVGRLDKNSVGVLLITNDGELTRALTHPSYKKKKIYQVSLDKALTAADMKQLAEGITLEDGEIRADDISYVNDSKKEVGIEIHSGRNRIVRRMFESLGYSVQKLDRVYFAGLTKKSLKRGAWRFLTPREVSMLKSGEYE